MQSAERERDSHELTQELLRLDAMTATALDKARNAFEASDSPSFGLFLVERGLIDLSTHREACGPDAGRVLASRYRLLRLVGRGGYGAVYRAHDIKDDRSVAVKLLDVAAADGPLGSGTRARFEREARVGLSLQHPNLVRTLDVGTDCGDMFLVMELIEGKTLEQILEERTVTPWEAVSIAMRVLDGLAAFHAGGLVHRDVKAKNVMMTVAGDVKLMDFGLAMGADFARLTRTGRVIGTPHAMAPEQILGQEIDARTDIYAAGVLLYHLLARQVPFEGRQEMAILYAILHEEPMPVERLAPELSPDLGAIVRRAMAKDRSVRYRSVGDMRQDLAALLDHRRRSAAGETVSLSLEAHRLAAPAGEGPPPLSGRASEIALFSQHICDVLEGRRLLCFLSGEAGIGKTRLADEAARRARAAGLAVVRGACLSQGGAYSYQPLVDGLRQALTERGVASDEDLDRFVAAEAPGLEGLVPVLRLVLSVGEGGAALGREQVYHAISRLLDALGRRGSFVLVEDVQWIDEGTVGILEHLLTAQEPQGMLMVTSARPEEVRATHPWEALRAQLSARGQLSEIPIGRLAQEDIAALVQSLEPAVDDQLTRRAFEESEGNPLYAIELLRLEAASAARAGPFDFAQGRPAHTAPMPERIRELSRRRLQSLSQEERDVLDVASVGGDVFATEPIAAALEMPRLTLLRILQRLERERRLVHPAKGGYRFDHGKIQEVLYAELSPELRAEYHLLLARHLEALPDTTDEIAAALADHLLAAGEKARALPHLLRAASRALQKQDLAEARRRLETVLAAAPEADPLRLRAAGQLCDVYASLGEHPRASELLRAALREARAAPAGAAVAEIELRLGTSLYYEGRLTEASATLEQALAAADALAIPALALVATGNIGNLHYVRGEWEPALDSYRRVLAGSHEPGMTITARNNIGNTLARMGRTRAALSELRSALDIASAEKLRDQVALTLHNIGVALYGRGRLRAAILFLERAEEIAVEIGFGFLLSWLWPYLGAAHIRLGSGREPLSLIERGISLAVRQASREHQAEGLCCLGEAHTHLGDGTAALRAFEEAAAIAATAGIAPLHARAREQAARLG